MCDSQHLTNSNFNPSSPTSQPSNGGHSTSRDTASERPKRYEYLPWHCQESTFPDYVERPHSTKVKLVRLPRMPSLRSEFLRQVLASRVTKLPQAETGKVLETLGSVKANKRRREQTLSLSARDNDARSSDGGARGSKKAKVDCDCDTNHSWWMTIKIGDLNEVLQRIDAAMGLAWKLECQSDDLDKIAVGNLIDLLKDSQGILESAKDDMRAEGGRDREA